ncbi:hypothetical protein WJX72_009713 [[Myrmecia] bisecta]|uniref:Uncharacterized protein n=1 Tax=[Myrmecia] bisecta TaxID=41462 RepID=A0AAW1PBC0_9CHLO
MQGAGAATLQSGAALQAGFKEATPGLNNSMVDSQVQQGLQPPSNTYCASALPDPPASPDSQAVEEALAYLRESPSADPGPSDLLGEALRIGGRCLGAQHDTQVDSMAATHMTPALLLSNSSVNGSQSHQSSGEQHHMSLSGPEAAAECAHVLPQEVTLGASFGAVDGAPAPLEHYFHDAALDAWVFEAPQHMLFGLPGHHSSGRSHVIVGMRCKEASSELDPVAYDMLHPVAYDMTIADLSAVQCTVLRLQLPLPSSYGAAATPLQALCTQVLRKRFLVAFLRCSDVIGLEALLAIQPLDAHADTRRLGTDGLLIFAKPRQPRGIHDLVLKEVQPTSALGWSAWKAVLSVKSTEQPVQAERSVLVHDSSNAPHMPGGHQSSGSAGTAGAGLGAGWQGGGPPASSAQPPGCSGRTVAGGAPQRWATSARVGDAFSLECTSSNEIGDARLGMEQAKKSMLVAGLLNAVVGVRPRSQRPAIGLAACSTLHGTKDPHTGARLTMRREVKDLLNGMELDAARQQASSRYPGAGRPSGACLAVDLPDGKRRDGHDRDERGRRGVFKCGSVPGSRSKPQAVHCEEVESQLAAARAQAGPSLHVVRSILYKAQKAGGQQAASVPRSSSPAGAGAAETAGRGPAAAASGTCMAGAVHTSGSASSHPPAQAPAARLAATCPMELDEARPLASSGRRRVLVGGVGATSSLQCDAPGAELCGDPGGARRKWSTYSHRQGPISVEIASRLGAVGGQAGPGAWVLRSMPPFKAQKAGGKAARVPPGPSPAGTGAAVDEGAATSAGVEDAAARSGAGATGCAATHQVQVTDAPPPVKHERVQESAPPSSAMQAAEGVAPHAQLPAAELPICSSGHGSEAVWIAKTESRLAAAAAGAQAGHDKMAARSMPPFRAQKAGSLRLMRVPLPSFDQNCQPSNLVVGAKVAKSGAQGSEAVMLAFAVAASPDMPEEVQDLRELAVRELSAAFNELNPETHEPIGKELSRNHERPFASGGEYAQWSVPMDRSEQPYTSSTEGCFYAHRLGVRAHIYKLHDGGDDADHWASYGKEDDPAVYLSYDARAGHYELLLPYWPSQAASQPAGTHQQAPLAQPPPAPAASVAEAAPAQPAIPSTSGPEPEAATKPSLSRAAGRAPAAGQSPMPVLPDLFRASLGATHTPAAAAQGSLPAAAYKSGRRPPAACEHAPAVGGPSRKRSRHTRKCAEAKVGRKERPAAFAPRALKELHTNEAYVPGRNTDNSNPKYICQSCPKPDLGLPYTPLVDSSELARHLLAGERNGHFGNVPADRHFLGDIARAGEEKKAAEAKKAANGKKAKPGTQRGAGQGADEAGQEAPAAGLGPAMPAKQARGTPGSQPNIASPRPRAAGAKRSSGAGTLGEPSGATSGAPPAATPAKRPALVPKAPKESRKRKRSIRDAPEPVEVDDALVPVTCNGRKAVAIPARRSISHNGQEMSLSHFEATAGMTTSKNPRSTIFVQAEDGTPSNQTLGAYLDQRGVWPKQRRRRSLAAAGGAPDAGSSGSSSSAGGSGDSSDPEDPVDADGSLSAAATQPPAAAGTAANTGQPSGSRPASSGPSTAAAADQPGSTQGPANTTAAPAAAPPAADGAQAAAEGSNQEEPYEDPMMLATLRRTADPLPVWQRGIPVQHNTCERVELPDAATVDAARQAAAEHQAREAARQAAQGAQATQAGAEGGNQVDVPAELLLHRLLEVIQQLATHGNDIHAGTPPLDTAVPSSIALQHARRGAASPRGQGTTPSRSAAGDPISPASEPRGQHSTGAKQLKADEAGPRGHHEQLELRKWLQAHGKWTGKEEVWGRQRENGKWDWVYHLPSHGPNGSNSLRSLREVAKLLNIPPLSRAPARSPQTACGAQATAEGGNQAPSAPPPAARGAAAAAEGGKQKVPKTSRKRRRSDCEAPVPVEVDDAAVVPAICNGRKAVAIITRKCISHSGQEMPLSHYEAMAGLTPSKNPRHTIFVQAPDGTPSHQTLRAYLDERGVWPAKRRRRFLAAAGGAPDDVNGDDSDMPARGEEAHPPAQPSAQPVLQPQAELPKHLVLRERAARELSAAFNERTPAGETIGEELSRNHGVPFASGSHYAKWLVRTDRSKQPFTTSTEGRSWADHLGMRVHICQDGRLLDSYGDEAAPAVYLSCDGALPPGATRTPAAAHGSLLAAAAKLQSAAGMLPHGAPRGELQQRAR